MCTAAGSTKRRKVILTAAFNGSNFHGSFGIPSSPETTVDSVLWKAAGAAGRLTLKDASRDLSAPPADAKVFSRASRTDKGVGGLSRKASCFSWNHPLLLPSGSRTELRGVSSGADSVNFRHSTVCACTCSGPAATQLSVADQEVEPSKHIPSLVRDLNSHLPADVQVLSAVRASKRMQARQAVVSRKYTYFMPLACLVDDSALASELLQGEVGHEFVLQHPKVQAAVAACRAAASQLVGTHPWHNFTQAKQRNALVS